MYLYVGAEVCISAAAPALTIRWRCPFTRHRVQYWICPIPRSSNIPGLIKRTENIGSNMISGILLHQGILEDLGKNIGRSIDGQPHEVITDYRYTFYVPTKDHSVQLESKETLGVRV